MSFDPFCYQSGLTGQYLQKSEVVDSPFQYEEKADLEISEFMYQPNHPDQSLYIQELARYLNQSVNREISTLILFTSKAAMNATYAELDDLLKLQVLLQSEQLSPKAIVDEHTLRIRSGHGSIIMGMNSFAEGVDLPGKLCERVIITRLPFPSLHHPIDKAHKSWLESIRISYFEECSLPAASIKLIQMCGRLLRTEIDSGTITITDKRLLSKTYGLRLLRSLPTFKQKFSNPKPLTLSL